MQKGNYVQLTRQAMSRFAIIGYLPPIMHGTIRATKPGLVLVANKVVASWFSVGFFEVVEQEQSNINELVL